MIFDELKHNISTLEQETQSYIEGSKEYFKLRLFKILMKGIKELVQVAILYFIALLALVLLSVAVSYLIGKYLDNIFYGFLCVGGFYVLIALIFYLLRNKLERPLLKKFSEFYFD